MVQATSLFSKFGSKRAHLLYKILTFNRNIEITDINPEYVWGGDAITLDDCDMVWIDRVTVNIPSNACQENRD